MLPCCCGTEVDLTAFFNIRWCSLWRLKDGFVSLFYVALGHKNWHWKEREFWRAPALLTRHPSVTRVFCIYHFIEGLWILPPAHTYAHTYRQTYKYTLTWTVWYWGLTRFYLAEFADAIVRGNSSSNATPNPRSWAAYSTTRHGTLTPRAPVPPPRISCQYRK